MLHAVILAGGSGTRFWPASRRLRPKQLLPIAPGSDESLIAATVRRIRPLCAPEQVTIATGAHLIEATRRALPELPPSAFLGEPAARNTAPCIAWASALIQRRDPDAVVMVLPSDHHIGDEPGFRSALELATRSAERAITTIGISPTRPETGYGYIEAGEELGDDLAGVRRVVRFVEKPDRARAEEYLKSDSYLWNSGMFFFRAEDLLAAVREHLPELARGLDRIESAAQRGDDAERTETAQVFPELPSISIDYGVMERLAFLHVVPASFQWSDLGSWQSAWELGDKDADGNAADPEAVLIDSRNSLVLSLAKEKRGRTIAVVGMADVCVIDTDDAVLVIPRERTQDVRQVVEALERKGRGEKL